MARQPKEITQGRREFLQNFLDCAESPSKFSEIFLGHKVFPYNARYLDCKNRFIIYRSGRQCGKTMSTAVKAIHWAFFAPMMSSTVNKDALILIAAPTQDQASIMFDRIRSLIVDNDFLKGFVIRSTRTEIWVKWFDGSGHTKIVTRATGDKGTSLRGYTPHVIIADECSFINREVLAAFLPAGLATKVQVWLTSTPFSKNSYFYDKHIEAQQPDSEWVEFHVRSYDNPLIKDDPVWLEEIKKMAKEKYTQEVEGEFLDVGDALIPHELLMGAISDKRPNDFARYYMGVDIARLGLDETVYTIIAVDDKDNVFVIDTENERQSNLVDVVGKVGEYCRRYPIETVFMDETGLGAGAVDLAKRQDLPVRGVVFSLTSKSEMYSNIRMLFENKRVFIKMTSQSLIRQLSLMRREYTEEGKLKVKSEAGVSDDYADSFALACNAISFGDAWHILDVGEGLKKALFG